MTDGSVLTVWADMVGESGDELVFESLLSGLPGFRVEVLRIPAALVTDYRNDGREGDDRQWRIDPRAAR